jgi:twitching motility protein PilI
MREFQSQLAARMHAARTGEQTQANLLGVMVGQTRCLLSLQEAGEIVPVGSIAQVPLTHDWFLGLTNVRGNLVSVIDLARFQGMESSKLDKDGRIVVLSPALAVNSGLLVSRVMGLRNITEMEEVESAADSPWVAQCYRDRESTVWTALSLVSIVQDPKFLHVGI